MQNLSTGIQMDIGLTAVYEKERLNLLAIAMLER